MTHISKLKETFEINLFNQSLFTQLILKSMVKNKNANIIHISSTSALEANKGRTAYLNATALIAQPKILSQEVGQYKIRSKFKSTRNNNRYDGKKYT